MGTGLTTSPVYESSGPPTGEEEEEEEQKEEDEEDDGEASADQSIEIVSRRG